MATASRTRPSPRPTALARLRIEPTVLAAWGVPALAGVAFALCAALAAAGAVAPADAVAGGTLALLVLLVFVGLRPLVGPGVGARDRAIGAALGLVVLSALYVPFRARLFPGTPLVEQAHVSAAGAGLPLRIPAAGHGAIDLLLEGKLPANPTGGAAPPVHFVLTLDAGGGETRTVDGSFADALTTQRLGRRGTAVVHQMRTAHVRVVPNPRREDVSVTKVLLEPATAEGLTISAYAHPLPGPLGLALATVVLLALVVSFDRLGPLEASDGALTLGTTAAIGTALALWTSNTAHPDFRSLIGSVMLGGLPGFGVGSLLWWIVKRLIDRPT